MKKILALVLALVMILSLTACGAKEEPAATEAPKAEAPLLLLKLLPRRLPPTIPAIWLSTPLMTQTPWPQVWLCSKLHIPTSMWK